MQRVRSYSSIMAALLRMSMGEGAGKIRMMRETSLSFNETNKFLFLLKENGMVEESQEKRGGTFRTTAKGVRFLSTLESLRQVQVFSSRI